MMMKPCRMYLLLRVNNSTLTVLILKLLVSADSEC